MCEYTNFFFVSNKDFSGVEVVIYFQGFYQFIISDGFLTEDVVLICSSVSRVKDVEDGIALVDTSHMNVGIFFQLIRTVNISF